MVDISPCNIPIDAVCDANVAVCDTKTALFVADNAAAPEATPAAASAADFAAFALLMPSWLSEWL